MTKTDTIVGLVGAILLVGVMIGVFAYEYNDGDGGLDDGRDAEPTVLSDDYSGSTDPSSDFSHPFTLEDGVLRLIITFDSTPSSPLPGTQDFTVSLLRDGQQVEQFTASGGEETEWTIEPIMAGDYELQVSVDGSNAGGSFSGTLEHQY